MAQQGRLARAVGTHQHGERPRLERELDPLEDRPAGAAADERADGQAVHAANQAARALRTARTRKGAPTRDVKTPSCSS